MSNKDIVNILLWEQEVVSSNLATPTTAIRVSDLIGLKPFFVCTVFAQKPYFKQPNI